MTNFFHLVKCIKSFSMSFGRLVAHFLLCLNNSYFYGFISLFIQSPFKEHLGAACMIHYYIEDSDLEPVVMMERFPEAVLQPGTALWVQGQLPPTPEEHALTFVTLWAWSW